MGLLWATHIIKRERYLNLMFCYHSEKVTIPTTGNCKISLKPVSSALSVFQEFYALELALFLELPDRGSEYDKRLALLL